MEIKLVCDAAAAVDVSVIYASRKSCISKSLVARRRRLATINSNDDLLATRLSGGQLSRRLPAGERPWQSFPSVFMRPKMAPFGGLHRLTGNV